jgi:hypothetical protein
MLATGPVLAKAREDMGDSDVCRVLKPLQKLRVPDRRKEGSRLPLFSLDDI